MKDMINTPDDLAFAITNRPHLAVEFIKHTDSNRLLSFLLANPNLVALFKNISVCDTKAAEKFDQIVETQIQSVQIWHNEVSPASFDFTQTPSGEKKSTPLMELMSAIKDLMNEPKDKDDPSFGEELFGKMLDVITGDENILNLFQKSPNKVFNALEEAGVPIEMRQSMGEKIHETILANKERLHNGNNTGRE